MVPSNIWRCNCPVCRLMVHRIVNRVAYSSVKEGGKQSHKKKTSNVAANIQSNTQQSLQLSKEFREKIGNRPAEIVKLTPPSPTPQKESIVKKSESKNQKKEQLAKRIQQQIQLPSVVTERLDLLEKEINKIKKYVRASIDGIKATLVDLRSAMAELSNPFNILRKYADLLPGTEKRASETQENTRHLTSQQPALQPVIPVIQYPPIVQSMPQQEQQRKQEREEVKEKIEKQEKDKENEARIDYELYVKLAQWVNKIIEQIPPDVLEKLVNNYVDIGVIDKRIGDALKKIIKTASELKSLGLSVDEQAKYLRDLVYALGLSNGEVVEKVLPATEKTGEDAAKELLDLIDKG